MAQDGPNRILRNEISLNLDRLIQMCRDVDGRSIEKRADIVLTLAEKNKRLLRLIPDSNQNIDGEMVKDLRKIEEEIKEGFLMLNFGSAPVEDYKKVREGVSLGLNGDFVKSLVDSKNSWINEKRKERRGRGRGRSGQQQQQQQFFQPPVIFPAQSNFFPGQFPSIGNQPYNFIVVPQPQQAPPPQNESRTQSSQINASQYPPGGY